MREQYITKCLRCISTSVAVGLSGGCRLRAGPHKHLHIQTANLSVTGKALSEDAFLKCLSSLSQSTDKLSSELEAEQWCKTQSVKQKLDTKHAYKLW